MKEAELLAKLRIDGDGDDHAVMLEWEGQIAFEEEPGVMLVDFSHENCVNCEYAPTTIQALQEHREAIVQWIADKGFEVNDCTGDDDPGPDDPGEDGPFGDGSDWDEEEEDENG